MSARIIEPFIHNSPALSNHKYYARPRADILEAARRCGMSGRVLDVGCASGLVGEALLAEDMAKEVIGIERNPAIAREASMRLTRVITGDATIEGVIPEGPYDGAILADVLEHIVEPEILLATVVGQLTPDACVIVSLPNVRHFRVLWDLTIRGTWRYTDVGICDRTHLRFFTLSTARELVETTALRNEFVLGTMSRRASLLCARIAPVAPFLANQFVLGCSRDRSPYISFPPQA